MGNPSMRQMGRYPLHITLSAVFTSLLLVVGTALIVFNFMRARSAALLQADHRLGMLAAHLETSVSELFGPAQNLVDLASRMRLSTNASAAERQRELGVLTEALRQRGEIESIFVGQKTVSFSLVRSLLGRDMARKAIGAPETALFAHQIIPENGGAEELVFFGVGDEIIGQRTNDRSDFDPREREWYRMAMSEEGQVATGAYVFFTTREVGVTIARRLATGVGSSGSTFRLPVFLPAWPVIS